MCYSAYPRRNFCTITYYWETGSPKAHKSAKTHRCLARIPSQHYHFLIFRLRRDQREPADGCTTRRADSTFRGSCAPVTLTALARSNSRGYEFGLAEAGMSSSTVPMIPLGTGFRPPDRIQAYVYAT